MTVNRPDKELQETKCLDLEPSAVNKHLEDFQGELLLGYTWHTGGLC